MTKIENSQCRQLQTFEKTFVTAWKCATYISLQD